MINESQYSPTHLETKRIVIGHVMVCSGCCCGAVNRGKPEVPVEWLKREWRSRGLLKNIQLTITGCLGPCDLPNVVKISGQGIDIWIGNIVRFEQYVLLLEWACASKVAGAFQRLPDEFDRQRFDPFRPAAA
jgi:cobaltochelatase CobN